jgi:signal peptidase I
LVEVTGEATGERRGGWWIWLLAAVLIAALGLGAWRIVADDGKTYNVPSGAMLPTLEVNSPIVVDQDDTDPEIGDVVVFHPPVGAEAEACAEPVKPGQVCIAPGRAPQGTVFVKRVVAGPGDTLRLVNGHAIVNGETVADESINPCREADRGCNFPREVTVPPETWFMLGDNRGASDDSRFWGPVPEEWILGTVTDPDV